MLKCLVLLGFIVCCAVELGKCSPKQPDATANDCICQRIDTVCFCKIATKHRLTTILDKAKQRLYSQLRSRRGNNKQLTADETLRLITADSFGYRSVVSINGVFIGPKKDSYRKTLGTDILKVHFRGIHQRRTYWNGVAFITQCPILSGGYTNIRFKSGKRGIVINDGLNTPPMLMGLSTCGSSRYGRGRISSTAQAHYSLIILTISAFIAIAGKASVCQQ